jgi:vitamin B12 transporter
MYAFRRPFGCIVLFFLSFFLATTLHAVSVHGTVTDPLGNPVENATVQLVHDGQTVATGTTGSDGSYVLTANLAGRFHVLAAATTFQQIAGEDFYGGAADSVEQKITLAPERVKQSVVVTATGTPAPQAQVSASVTQLDSMAFENRTNVSDALRQVPGLAVVQTGELGGVTSIFVRGGSSSANRVVLDGIPIEDLGGQFDFGNVSSTGLAAAEIYRGPNTVLYGSDAAAGVIALSTPRGSTSWPVMEYEGDAGNFNTHRAAEQISGMHRRLDYFGGVSGLWSANSLPMDQYRDVTSAANLGWSLSSKTGIRATARNSDSSVGLPGTYSFFDESNDGKQLDQDTYVSGAIDHTFQDNWHGILRYGLARKREQSDQWYPAGTLINGNYYGNPVTITGANGYSVSGQTLMNYSVANFGVYPNRIDLVNNRDNLYAQTDYQFNTHIGLVAGFRYEDERGAERSAAFFINDALERANYDYQLQLGGQWWNRLFYSVGGGVEKNQLFGTVGSPRVGVSYYLVRPGARRFQGTKLNFNFAKGYQEPTITDQLGSLYDFLNENGGAATAKQYGIGPIGAELSRTYDGGVEQSLFGERALLRIAYFHNEFGNQIESVGAGLIPTLLPQLSPAQQALLEAFLNANFAFSLDLNSMSFKAQGIESSVEYGVGKNVFVRAGYTWLDAVVQHSFSSDAVSPTTTGTNFPNTPIGIYSPLRGARPFRRPPQSGFASLTYTGKRWTGILTGAFAGRSDDSTYLGYSDLNQGNTLLLPNRDLDFGYAKVDLGATYQVKPWMAVYTQLNNLLSQQHIGPIGYPSLPFNFRTGLRFVLGREQSSASDQ